MTDTTASTQRPAVWRTFRFRITLWYLAFFSFLFLFFSLLLHSVFFRALESHLDDALAAEADTGTALFQDEFKEENGDILRAAHECIADMRPRSSVVAVLAGSRVLSSSAAIPPPQIDSIASQAAANPAYEFAFTMPQAGAHGARVSLQRVSVGGKPYVFVALQPLDEIAASLALLRRVLAISFPVMILLAGIGGYWLARRSLAPLGWMADQARRISGSNLDARLEIGNAAAELVTLSASFNELLSRLDLSFETIRRFVADASHELRTPLSIIRGEADVALAQPRTAAEYRETLAVIQDESRRLSRLVDDLLNLARADAGRVKLQREEFYLNDLLGECCRSAQSLSSARNITLDCQAPADVSFRGDEELLRRLVMNLLDNAIRYTPAGGKVTAVLDTTGPELQIRVSDTGIGIPPEAAPLIFDRFYRADKARTRSDGGFGLGLAIVKWIAESHQGAVNLASTPGAGSTFTVSLPRLLS